MKEERVTGGGVEVERGGMAVIVGRQDRWGAGRRSVRGWLPAVARQRGQGGAGRVSPS